MRPEGEEWVYSDILGLVMTRGEKRNFSDLRCNQRLGHEAFPEICIHEARLRIPCDVNRVEQLMPHVPTKEELSFNTKYESHRER